MQKFSTPAAELDRPQGANASGMELAKSVLAPIMVVVARAKRT